MKKIKKNHKNLKGVHAASIGGEQIDRLLIVCEGTKTEPEYFRQLINKYKLSTVNIELKSSDKSDPKSIVKFAKKLDSQLKRQGDKYDRIYCVFDRDNHPNFEDALAEIKSAKFYGALSWPCFEYWILLHFHFTRKPFNISGTKSACDQCISELKTYLPNYNKDIKGIFHELFDNLDTATTNADLAISDVERTGEPNPSTYVHTLVKDLKQIANSQI